ncbi:MAG TPA: hypothetical protein VGN39_16440 [Terriglobales bacterium]|nr:hypothetical protein [Terriglobales bacterium]
MKGVVEILRRDDDGISGRCEKLALLQLAGRQFLPSKRNDQAIIVNFDKLTYAGNLQAGS